MPALTRVFCLTALCAGCAAPHAETVVLRGSDRVIGRAALDSQVVMITNEPALIRISSGSRQVTRLPISTGDRSKPKLWGLGEIENELYAVSAFKRLVRLEISDASVLIQDVAGFDRPAGNLVDTPSGMAIQYAVGDIGEPIARAVGKRGEVEPMPAPARAALGLAPAEEGLLHLLTCSVPPRALCWLPGSNQLLVIDERGIGPLVTLDVPRIAPSLLIARPAARAIQDALRVGDDLLIVLFQHGADAGTVLGEFNLAGRMVRELAPSQPLRLLVTAGPSDVRAITQSGVLTEVAR